MRIQFKAAWFNHQVQRSHSHVPSQKQHLNGKKEAANSRASFNNIITMSLKDQITLPLFQKKEVENPHLTKSPQRNFLGGLPQSSSCMCCRRTKRTIRNQGFRSIIWKYIRTGKNQGSIRSYEFINDALVDEDGNSHAE